MTKTMDYKSMAQEYYEAAERMKAIEDKYRKLAESSGESSREKLNAKVFHYHLLYSDALRTAKVLEKQAERIRSGQKYLGGE